MTPSKAKGLSHHGWKSGAVAVQGFFQNLAMLIGVGAYTLASASEADPSVSITVMGVIVLIATVLVAWRLPPDSEAAEA